MSGGAVVEHPALTHQPPHVFLLSQPVRRVGSFPRGGERTVCAVVWWLQAHTHQPPSHMSGGAVVEHPALTHQPPHVLLLSQPVRRVGSFPRGGEWTVCAVVWWLQAHTHQPPSHMSGGAVVEHPALTHQPPHVLLLSQPVRRVGSFPRGGEWTVCAVVWWLQAHTHQPPSHMLGGAVVERRALTHQPPHVFLLSQPVRRVGSFPRGGEWTACAVVWWLSAHTHQPPSHMLGGAVVERCALPHLPPHAFPPRRSLSGGPAGGFVPPRRRVDGVRGGVVALGPRASAAVPHVGGRGGGASCSHASAPPCFSVVSACPAGGFVPPRRRVDGVRRGVVVC